MLQAKMRAAVVLYSTELNRAVKYCVETNPKDRADAYALYRATKCSMEQWRAVAEVEAATATRNGLPPQCFPQQRFETDPHFAELYRQHNHARIWVIFKPPAAKQSKAILMCWSVLMVWKMIAGMKAG